ncbi:hypothetical protein [Exiguobacterium sp. s37]|uniref:hypothetical protein n=1 Tax=Exiguobacterium sp. s37 TaxID=2751275 RepID=UPI001BE81C9A|nr:hypothetical protein [Exiguobacterium sp. s37]
MKKFLWFIIITFILLVFVVPPMIVFTPVLIFIAILLRTISFGARINEWEERLRHRNIKEDEFIDLYTDMKTMWWVPNSPVTWGRLRKIYFSSLHSRELTLEQKRQLYDVFQKLSVRGIPYPQDRKNQHRPDDVKYDVF